MVLNRRDVMALTAGFAFSSIAVSRACAQIKASGGPPPTGDDDRLEAILAGMTRSGRANIPSGTYRLTRPLVVPPGLLEGGDVIFDFRKADPAVFVDRICVRIEGANKTRLPDLANNLMIGARIFTFKTGHGLIAKDAFQLSGTVDFAGNGYRRYYRKGEIFRVARVIDAKTVEVEEGCRDTYPRSGVTCWKRAGDRFRLACKSLRIIAPDTIDYAARFITLDQSTIDGLRVEGGSVAAADFLDCYGVSGSDIEAVQRSNSFDGYGVAINYSQAFQLSGQVHGFFNGIATGGGGPGPDGMIGMNRDIHFEGTASSDPKGGLSGANFHGNTEYSSYRGVFTNGVTLAGNHNEAYGEFIGKSGQPAVLFGEMHGHSFLVSGTVRTTGAELPPNAGAINMGSSGDDYGSHARYGGRTIFDVEVHAAQASRIILWRTTGLARKDVALEFRRFDLVETHPGYRAMVLSKVSGGDMPLIEFDKLNVRNNVAIDWSVNPGTKIIGATPNR